MTLEEVPAFVLESGAGAKSGAAASEGDESAVDARSRRRILRTTTLAAQSEVRARAAHPPPFFVNASMPGPSNPKRKIEASCILALHSRSFPNWLRLPLEVQFPSLQHVPGMMEELTTAAPCRKGSSGHPCMAGEGQRAELLLRLCRRRKMQGRRPH